MADFSEYTDPRLVTLYDPLCTHRRDTDFYLGLAAEFSASSVIDIGCGTGLLACDLAASGHDVIGVDPSPAMIDYARNRPGGDLVRWIEGDASLLDAEQADLVVMNGHVAQVIADHAEWDRTLAGAHRALRPGGRIAFETRNPGVHRWTVSGATEGEPRHAVAAGLGKVKVWYQVTDVDGDLVRFQMHYLVVSTGEELVSGGELRFRTQGQLTRSLTETGFSVDQVFGDWGRQSVGPDSPELIFIATRE
ncbi:Methyltransferase domain-containing protein [Amycolatopsis marina]|uniref:Methyltransferase domain-containing protein n=1 Tax=Amycolatopsis marina TaxID=490629 RepID=A0A1I0VPU9_9PSEU|nr:class I SAM-dependent methyltransferase [Amycolatopsis marina]SFA78268.1 Methyltransferase domain-containing protein [Amycolatopsis marina]